MLKQRFAMCSGHNGNQCKADNAVRTLVLYKWRRPSPTKVSEPKCEVHTACSIAMLTATLNLRAGTQLRHITPASVRMPAAAQTIHIYSHAGPHATRARVRVHTQNLQAYPHSHKGTVQPMLTSFLPRMTGVVPTDWLTTQLPLAQCGMSLNMPLRSSSLPCRKRLMVKSNGVHSSPVRHDGQHHVCVATRVASFV